MNKNYFTAIPTQTDTQYNKWFEQKIKISEGYIREVYLENILTNKHLNKPFSDNLTFGDVIRKDNKMGIITEIYNDCYHWKIESENVEYARRLLSGKNVIIE